MMKIFCLVVRMAYMTLTEEVGPGTVACAARNLTS